VHDNPGRRWRIVLAVMGAGYALAAAATTPFSRWADVVTAVAIVTLSVAAAFRWPARPQPLRPASGGGRPFLAWSIFLAVVVAFELAEYLARGGRAAHPTLSSMADAVDRHYLLKALLFFGWLCLGVVLVHLGAAGGASPQPEAEVP
jgi:hypothetical protein